MGDRKKTKSEPPEETPPLERPDHQVVARMELSGTIISVGVYTHPSGDSLYFKTESEYEPTYISVAELDLLVAALLASKARLTDE